MKKQILIVDNRLQIAFDWFKQFTGDSVNIQVTNESTEAIELINKTKFDYVFVNSEVEDLDSGMNVINSIVTMIHSENANVPKNIIIHSIEGKISREMEMNLIRGGYPIKNLLRRPYFEKTKLIDFIKMRADFNYKV